MGPMPELADYSETGFDQFQPPPPLPPQPPSQAEQRRLQQYFDHRNRVDTDEGEANIDFDTAEAARQQLDQAAAPLMQKASEWEQYQKQQQRAQVTDEMAFEQSIKRANMAHDAQGFPEHMSHQMLVGPDGMPQQVSFYQTEPGKWAQADLAPVTSAEGLGDTTPAPDTGEGDVSEGLPSMRTEQPGQGETPHVTSNPDGSQQLTIQNGRYRTEAVYGPDGRLASQQMYGPDGQPVQPQLAQASQQFGVPPDVLARIQQQAYQLFPGNDVHSATSRGHLINRGISAYHTNALVEKRAQLQAQKAQQDEHDTNFGKQLDAAEKRLTSQWEKAHPGEEMTPEAAESLHDQAIGFAHRRFESIYGKKHRGGYQAGEVAPADGMVGQEAPASPVSKARRLFVAEKLGTAHDYNKMLDPNEAPKQKVATDPQTGVQWDTAKLWKMSGDEVEPIKKRIVEDLAVKRVETMSGKTIARAARQQPAQPTAPPPHVIEQYKKARQKITLAPGITPAPEPPTPPGGGLQGDVPGNFNIPG